MSVPATAAPNTPAPGAEAPSTGQTGGAPNAQEQRADPTPVSDAGTQEQVTRSPDFVREAFQRLRGYTQNAAPAPAPTEQRDAPGTGSQAPPASGSPVSEPERSVAQPSAPAGASSGSAPATTLPPAQQQQRPPERSATAGQGGNGQLVLTPEELQRRVQAEADRILAKQKKDDEARAAQEQERELRRTDPFSYARLMEQREQELEASRAETKRLTDVIGTQLVYYDRAVLDTFVGALPDTVRSKVIATEGDGIENRKATASNTLKALRDHWRAEGRASAKAELMKDQTFVKEILARFGQATPEPEASPVAIRPTGEAAPESGNEAVNAWMRTAARTTRTGR